MKTKATVLNQAANNLEASAIKHKFDPPKKPVKKDKEKEPTHVDDFIDYGSNIRDRDAYPNETYARWVLNHMRLPAMLQWDFGPFMKDHKLFCTFEGERYRVAFASRMAWVGLSKDLKGDSSYDTQVCVDDITDWGKKP